MALNIKNARTERLARELAAATGESVTAAITIAVEQRLKGLNRPDESAAAERVKRIRAIARDAAPRWREPFASMEHGDLLYDEAGLPR
ncbi:MAG TPA: type II toxin-antitoxin system VapB family antitoxin [Motilibacteraceae bacterium]|nr:type II toxin-antitoxin system VapB family antitoxin [Motilibacteraceae bacterium]